MNHLASESGCFCGIPEDGTINSSHEVGGIPREEGTRRPVLQTEKLPAPTEAYTKVTGEDDVQKMLIWSVSYSPFRGG